jgi:hypothetical protein
MNRAESHRCFGCQVFKVLTKHGDFAHISRKVKVSERFRTVLSASLCAIAPFLGGNLPTHLWYALASRCFEIYDSSRLH